MTIPPVSARQYLPPPRYSPVAAWRRVRRCAIRGIACCAVWPLGLAIAGLVSAGGQSAPITGAITAAVAVASVVSIAAFFAAKAALWWHGES